MKLYFRTFTPTSQPLRDVILLHNGCSYKWHRECKCTHASRLHSCYAAKLLLAIMTQTVLAYNHVFWLHSGYAMLGCSDTDYTCTGYMHLGTVVIWCNTWHTQQYWRICIMASQWLCDVTLGGCNNTDSTCVHVSWFHRGYVMLYAVDVDTDSCTSVLYPGFTVATCYT